MNDPINPAHYDGTACAQIGERLTGNSYQVLKYNWRLGKKDDPVIEVGKSIWYLDREILIGKEGFRPNQRLPDDLFFEAMLMGVDAFVNYVAWRLVDWNRNKELDALYLLRNALIEQRAKLERDATGQETMPI